jgi:pilus assembly protein Flp/PilA
MMNVPTMQPGAQTEGFHLMLDLIAMFVSDDSGAAGVEYGMLVALIAAVIVGTVSTLGAQIKSSFSTITAALAIAG